MRATVGLLLIAGALAAGCVSQERAPHEPVGGFELRSAVGPATGVQIHNSVGRITVVPSADEIARARIEAFYKGGVDELGREAGPTDFVLEVTGDMLVARSAHLEGDDDESWRMDIRLEVPSGLSLEVRNGVGNCSVAGIGEALDLEVKVGDVTASADRAIPVAIRVQVGTVELKLGGSPPFASAVCETGVGDVSIEAPRGFDGSVSLDSAVGAVQIRGAPELAVRRAAVTQSASGRLGSSDAEISARTGVGEVMLVVR